MLDKTRTIMELSTKTRMLPPFTIPFDCQDEDDPKSEYRNHQLYLDKEVWEQMDTPTTITVTIEPGDKLNEEGS